MTLTGTDRFEVQLESLLAVAEEIRRGARREGDTLHPLGPKAARTRAALIEAGVDVFCEHGYQASSVGDVHERAGVSLGTFYQYFRDKTDLVATIVAEAVVTSANRIWPGFDADRGPAGVATVVDGFVQHYASTIAFQRVWEEVTQLEPTVAELRARMSRLLETSLAASIATGQDRGEIDVSLDPMLAARALAAMVDRTCYLTFVLDGRDAGAAAEVSHTLAHLWSNALGLERG
jgi:AcrR family transcriptional regulator